MKLWTKITLGLLVAFLLLQFIPLDRSTPKLAANQDFLQITQAPAAIATMIKNTCYDCHSYETKYPWYANIAPASWWLQGHVNGGRQHLNFSNWPAAEEKEELLEESAEEITKEKMPLNSYTWLHPEASLSKEQKQQLTQWFEQTAATMK